MLVLMFDQMFVPNDKIVFAIFNIARCGQRNSFMGIANSTTLDL